MKEFVINDYLLNQEAREIVDEILSQADEGQDIEELIWQAVDGHEWVIYTYKALKLCAECNTDEGEALLEDTGQTFPWGITSLSDHATAVAYWTLYAACRDYLNELEEAA